MEIDLRYTDDKYNGKYPNKQQTNLYSFILIAQWSVLKIKNFLIKTDSSLDSSSETKKNNNNFEYTFKTTSRIIFIFSIYFIIAFLIHKSKQN